MALWFSWLFFLYPFAKFLAASASLIGLATRFLMEVLNQIVGVRRPESISD